MKNCSDKQITIIYCNISLCSPLGKLADRAIYFIFRSFFLFLNADKLSQDPLDRFSRYLHQMIGICFNMPDLDLFFIPLGTLPWQPILWQNLGIWVHSAERRLKTAYNIAITIQKYSMAISYILRKMMKIGPVTPENRNCHIPTPFGTPACWMNVI